MEGQGQQSIAQPSPPQKKGISQKTIGIIVVGVIAIVIIAALAVALSSAANADQVKIVVRSSGSWSMAVAESGSSHTYSGTGDQTITYTRTQAGSINNAVAVILTSMSFSTVEVKITTMDGKVLAEGSGTLIAYATWDP